MTDRPNPHRRTVLKTLGASVIGTTTLAGTASADDTGDNRRQDSFTWADDTLYEMLESEPHPVTKDSEGSEPAHRPLWVIASMAGTEVAGSEHSPHPNPDGLPIDHVVPLVDFSAQWHVHLVFDATGNFTNTDHEGRYLTSASRIQNANNVEIIPTETVFTCPIRPHTHK